MALPLTPHVVAAAYGYLRACPPFKGWKLPHADEVEFGVTRHRDREGDHNHYLRTTEHILRVSSYRVQSTLALLMCVAHEMTHMYQWRVFKSYTHNAWFNRTTKRISLIHDWPLEEFK